MSTNADESGSEDVETRRPLWQLAGGTAPSARTAPSSSSRPPRTTDKDDTEPARLLQAPASTACLPSTFQVPSVDELILEESAPGPQPSSTYLAVTSSRQEVATEGPGSLGPSSISAQGGGSAVDVLAADVGASGEARSSDSPVDEIRETPTEESGQSGADRAEDAERDVVEECSVPLDALAALRVRYLIQCAACMGEYVESVLPVMEWGGVKLLTSLLQRARELGMPYLGDALRLLGNFLAHRRYLHCASVAAETMRFSLVALTCPFLPVMSIKFASQQG